MTQNNAQSTSEQIISENDLIAQRHAKLKQIQDHAKKLVLAHGQTHLNVNIMRKIYKTSLLINLKKKLKLANTFM